METGETGIAVASRFFYVGSVVPWLRAGIGGVATQSNANTSFGPRGLELLERGASPQEALDILLRADAGRDGRQLGIVAPDGRSVTYTGSECTAWAGGRSGPGYAVQGNILAGEAVVAALEKGFLESKGFNGFGDRAIDVRVDDHADPLGEIARLTHLALVNDTWNRAWAAFTGKRFAEALPIQRTAVALAEQHAPGMLGEVVYDLAVILQANGAGDEAVGAARRAIGVNPRLREQALRDKDLETLRSRIVAP
jgi:uncharacterized Ntn-hydrolase superfamily protein